MRAESPICIIPARYASQRLPGKLLLDLGGKSILQRVYEVCASVIDSVYVATDDQRIMQAVQEFGGVPLLTSVEHQNGTSRCYEAACILRRDHGVNCDRIINIQGDEAQLTAGPIQDLLAVLDSETEFATLVSPARFPQSIRADDSEAYVVFNRHHYALYFSRFPIPAIRDGLKQWGQGANTRLLYRHVGIYAYRFEALGDFVNMSPSALEQAECLEQLRWLEAGRTIKIGFTEFDGLAVDTQEDLERLRKSVGA